MKLTLGFKIAIGIVIAAIAYAVLAHLGYAPGTKIKEAEVAKSFDLPADAGVAVADDPNVTPVSLPSAKPANLPGTPIRINIWAWNAQMGLIFANGGPATTSGSLMEKHKVKLQITRQDDTEKSKPEQIKFAQLLAKGGADPTEGIQYVIIMGDGAAQYLASVNKELSKIGDDYRAEIVGAVGYSRGEDAFWGPAAWKDNPEAMKGGLTAGVLRDGDWNIPLYLTAQNNIKNNPDEHTYDPEALNWVASDTYLTAVQQYIAGYCEDRPVVSNGKKTGEKKNVCVDSVVTWTPGDVNIAKGKGGLVRILSTKENIYQMPSVLIGIHKWNVSHKTLVQELLAATFEGSDQVRHFDQALQRAGQASYAIYKEESPAYWVKYYKGTIERDKTGIMVPLGGSTVANLADNLVLFGLAPGSGGLDASLFHATYEGFGNIVKQQYPRLFPSFPPTAKAVDTSYLESLAKTNKITLGETQTFNGGPIAAEDVRAKKDWNINFDTGKNTLTPIGEATLTDLYNQLIVGGGLAVEIDGHTDDVGDPKSNQTLSEARAFAVKQWLEQKAPKLFPEGRVSIQAFGQSRPLVPNSSPENRAKNRRVTIILGTH